MKEKETANTCQSDEQAAGALAAASVAKFFKEQDWKIISFFPNTPCLCKAKELLAKKEKGKNTKKTS